MGLIPQHFIDELIARTDIVEVIGARVQLKKAGREFKACCPFHNEKTASFWVSPDKQFYHCFGCGAHGTALRFLMEYDRLSFPEAVEELANRLGIEVPHEANQGGGTRSAEEALHPLMAQVAQHYAECLAGDARAKAYVERRGLTPATLTQFGIGYAPNAWNEVLRRFGRDEPARQQLKDLGLIVERERTQGREGERHYDRFRDRIIFPIRDVRGRVIAFGGRVIDQGEPKYLNSPETVLFHKGRELYGLFETRRSRAPLKRLLVVEGYMDAVQLHQAGIACAVATLGTSTTPEHFKRIFRLVNEVVFAFDGDRAGRAAAWRALQHALPEAREGREIRFLFLPEGHDPDSLVRSEGRAAFETRLETGTLPLSEYLVRELSEQVDLSHADGRASFAEHARPLYARVPDGVYRELLLARLAEVVGLSAERLGALWGAGQAAGAAGASNPGRAVAGAPAPGPVRPARTRTGSGRGSLVRQAVVRLVRFPAIARDVTDAERAALADCEEPGLDLLRELLDELRTRPAQSPAQVIERWAGRPQSETLQRLLELPDLVSEAATASAEFKASLARLAERSFVKRLELLEEKSRTARLDPEEMQEFQRLIGRLGSRDARGA